MWTMRTIPILLAVALLACGGEEEGPPAAAPPGGEAVPAAGGVLEGGIRPELLTLADWEWFSESPNRLSRIAGRVTDPEGEPVSGAVATLLVPPPVPMAPAFPARTVVAGDAGEFEFTDVPFNCWVRIEAPGHGGRIFLAPELQPRGEQAAEAALPPAGEIRGLVRGEDDAPVAGVEVMVSNQGPRFAKSARTDEQGRFVMTDVPVGTHLAWLMSDTYRGETPGIEVKAGEGTDCEIRAKRPARITLKVLDARTNLPIAGVIGSTLHTRETILAADEEGVLKIEGACFPRIWVRGAGFAEMMFDLAGDRTVPRSETVVMQRAGTIRGRVVDEAGRPIGGARVEVIPRPDRPGLPVRGPLTAADGTFEVSWVPVGETPESCAVVARWPGHHLKRSGEATLAAGGVAEGVEVVLSPHRRAKLKVLTPDGEPAAWAVVGLKGLSPIHVGANFVFHSGASGTTGPDGTVTLSGLAPGPTEVEVMAKEHVPVKTVREIGTGPVTDLGEIRLEVGLAISGKVESSRGELPRGVRIRLSARGFRDTLAVPEDGTFTYEGLPEGPVHLRVEAPGHEPVMKVVQAGTGKLRIVLRALSDLTVSIVRPEDVLLEGWLEVLPIGGMVRERNPIVRELRGRVASYVFQGLVAGKYRVRVSAGDFYGLAVVTIAQGESATAKITFRRGCSVRGKILRPDGVPAAGVGVSLLSAGPWGRTSVRTGRDGGFLFRGIPPGEMTLKTHPPGFAPLEYAILVAEGGDADVKLKLRTGGRIFISVKDGANRPLAGIRISLTREDGSPARYWIADNGPPQTGGNGTLVLTGLAAGDYELSLFRGEKRLEWGKVPVEEDGAARVEAYFRK